MSDSRLLFILKPDAVWRRRAGAESLHLVSSFPTVRFRSLNWTTPTEALLATHYEHVSTRPFFPWLMAYLAGRRVLAGSLLVGKERVGELRDLIGTTIVESAAPGTLRERFGVFSGVNCVHLSDSDVSGDREVQLWQAAGFLPPEGSLVETEKFYARRRMCLDLTVHYREVAQRLQEGTLSEAVARCEIRGLLLAENPCGLPPEMEMLLDTIVGGMRRSL